MPDVARQYGLGYQEIVAANPNVDPWLPQEGSQVIIPNQHILPSVPRKGIVINLAEMRLYHFTSNEEGFADSVRTYPIGIGQEGWSTPIGITTITQKIDQPAWTVPDSILAEREAEGIPLPKIVAPGSPDNPLGDLAMRLALSDYLIHGTDKPYGIGRRISHGCIRMYPEDIEELFHHVSVGTRVWIVDQPYKVGQADGKFYLEAHEPIVEPGRPTRNNLDQVINSLVAVTGNGRKRNVLEIAVTIAAKHSGMATEVVDIGRQESGFARNGKVIQLGAFLSLYDAQRLLSMVGQEDLPISVRARSTDGYCHVLVGPYHNQQVLSETLIRLKELTGIEGTIMPANRHGLLSSCQS